MNLRPIAPIENPVRFFGKYRGIVTANVDPLQLGRVMAQVPAVSGTAGGTWAMPCVPAAGMQSGIFIVPPIGSSVWVEFEGGDPSLPIWTGGFWPLAAEVPISAAQPPIPPGQNIVIQTTGENMIALSDSAPTPVSGGIVLKGTSGAAIVLNSTGIYISNGQGASVTLVGPDVYINNQPFL